MRTFAILVCSLTVYLCYPVCRVSVRAEAFSVCIVYLCIRGEVMGRHSKHLGLTRAPRERHLSKNIDQQQHTLITGSNTPLGQRPGELHNALGPKARRISQCRSCTGRHHGGGEAPVPRDVILVCLSGCWRLQRLWRMRSQGLGA